MTSRHMVLLSNRDYCGKKQKPNIIAVLLTPPGPTRAPNHFIMAHTDYECGTGTPEW